MVADRHICPMLDGPVILHRADNNLHTFQIGPEKHFTPLVKAICLSCARVTTYSPVNQENTSAEAVW
jgi:hypothetical protein